MSRRIKSSVSEKLKKQQLLLEDPESTREAHPGLHPQEHFQGLVPDLGVCPKSLRRRGSALSSARVLVSKSVSYGLQLPSGDKL